MKSVCRAVLTLLGVASAAPLAERAASYDYVIIGCGISGLVVANRLSADPANTVLCIEAGPFDGHEEDVIYPFLLGSEVGGRYDWNIGTIPQAQLNGNARPLPAGHVVGGGSVINGMVWNRGCEDDFDAWESLGNPGWSWNDLLPYFKRSETYTAKTYPGQNPQPVTPEASVHGTSGPVQVSYPNYYWPQSNAWFAANTELNVPTIADPDAGLSAGAYYLPADIDAKNQTRCTARIAYYDPIHSRSNLHIMANTHVTRIIFGSGTGNLHATGVEYAASASAAVQTVTANVEVIVAAGGLHSPQVLQLSGIGPTSVLEAAGVNVLSELPGVGANLQDHGLCHIPYPYTNPSVTTPYTVVYRDSYSFQFSQSAHNSALGEYLASKTGPLTAIPSNALSFPSLPQIIDNTPDFVGAARTAPRNYPSGYESTLQAGYEKQLTSLLDRLLLDTTPAYECLNNNAGGLDIAIQHPLSRGTVRISTSNAFVAPLIDPRWLISSFDRQLMIAAMEFNQKILHTSAIQALQPSYGFVSENASPDELNTYLNNNVGTEYHYSGTCAMLPLSLGGVVDPNLLVYGTNNVRVIDTSIYPMVPAAHLSAVVYAVAEKAADIILGA